MKAVFVHDTFYSRAPGGEVYSFGAFPYSLWQERFLPHFNTMTIIGRERPYNRSHAQIGIRSDGPGVRFMMLPGIHTAYKRIFGAADVIAKISAEVATADAVIVRGPVEFAMIAARAAKLTKVKLTGVNKPATIPLAIEMSGCAFDHSWYHGSLTGKFYAPLKFLRARQMVKSADHVIYVTEKFLQRRYPATGTVANASNVEIEAPSSSVIEKRLYRIENQKSIVFGMIGSIGNRLKGIDVAISALSRIHYKLPPFELRVLGHGNPLRSRHSFVRYYDPISNKDSVLEWLDDVDIYLQPSLHEGLPRAVIEAMSRACPVLASDAGGIPELLERECIHRRGDSKGLSDNILSAMSPAWQKEQAEINFEKSKDYTRGLLLPRREKFWADFASFAAKIQKSELARKAKHKDILVKV
jgi:glycosyltransferase involved in cell wall biosynthesis